ncbi:TetR/AcrR family transcriptional regulator [Streptomyces violaceusniger]|uniref:TetR/AcrR family transcriptional regulator n=1 Tax=Streptomyces violaceusniger TaxID=68280 RepID=UPI003CD06ED9
MAAVDREPRLRADAQRNRARLLEVARAAFADGQTPTLEAAAREAGVGIGTLYRHYPTREALIEAVYRAERAQLCSRVEPLLAEHEPVTALRTWMDQQATARPSAPLPDTSVHQPWSGHGALTVKPPRTRPALHTRHPLQTGAALRNTEVSSPRSSPSERARRRQHGGPGATSLIERRGERFHPAVRRSLARPGGRVAGQWFAAGSGVWAGRRAVRGPPRKSIWVIRVPSSAAAAKSETVRTRSGSPVSPVRVGSEPPADPPGRCGRSGRR